MMPPQSAYPLSSITGNLKHRHSVPIRKPKKILYVVGILFALYWFGLRHGLGKERDMTPLGFAVKGGRVRKSSLRYDKLGLAVLEPPKDGGGQHPIYELLETAEEKWHTLLSSQSQTLEEAVEKYKEKYILDPPRGFDKWWEFVENKGIVIRDEYDQMMKDLLPHHALPPATFIKRSANLQGQDFTFTLDVMKKRVKLEGHRAGFLRPKQMHNLVEGIRTFLPDDFSLRVVGSDHDTGSDVLAQDQRERAMDLVRKGEYFDEAELKHLESPDRNKAFGWFKACLPSTPAHAQKWAENHTRFEPSKSFVHDHLATMDFCEYPEWKRLHGAMAIDYYDRSRSHLKPIMVLSKFPMDSSFQITPMEGYLNLTAEDLPYEGVWEEKTDHRAFWRGSTTGGFDKWRDWRESHRLRLHLMVNGPREGGSDWDKIKEDGGDWGETVREVLMPDGNGGYRMTGRFERTLSKAYMDVKLAGSATQCPEERFCDDINDNIEFGDKISPEESYMFKYALDVDGNGWSSRFHRLISSASPVIKMTMFPEWHMEWLVPWYHYIPLKPDYSDLYDIMAFFAGPVDEHGAVNEALGHDHLAKKIGEAGQKFALEHWSWANMQAYIFRLLLELQRLHNEDREAYSFQL